MHIGIRRHSTKHFWLTPFPYYMQVCPEVPVLQLVASVDHFEVIYTFVAHFVIVDVFVSITVSQSMHHYFTDVDMPITPTLGNGDIQSILAFHSQYSTLFWIRRPGLWERGLCLYQWTVFTSLLVFMTLLYSDDIGVEVGCGLY